MKTQNWKVYDKKGSSLNLFADSYLNLQFVSTAQNAIGASGYAITDPSSLIIYGSDGVKITNSGWEYDAATQVSLSYTFGTDPGILTSQEASINFTYVYVCNPSCHNSLAIGGANLDISTAFTYPSVTFTSAIFLDPVSQGLVETEHLSFLQKDGSKWIRPYDTVNPTLIFSMDPAGDPEIKLFTVDETTQLVQWSDEVVVDVSVYLENFPLIANIGFRAEDEGVFERKLRVYHLVGEQRYLLYEILCNAESIGPDERFDTLITDFGLPSPKANHRLFKEADINEDLPDWQLLNQKGKHIILEHDKIMPFIGTYKALINAIKWLGYEDIKVKEWFSNVKDGTKLSLTVPYEAADRTKTIMYFTPDERRNLKKLNQLSLVYCITRETGQVDDYGTPITENCYTYNLDEIFVKLYSLKQWLERWVIGVNARITDITGEGVYFERYKSIVYSTQNYGTVANFTQSLSPMTVNPDSELVYGDASMLLTLKELHITAPKNLPLRFQDLVSYYWDPSNGAYSPADASKLSYYDPSTIFVGNSANTPLKDLYDIQWKASVSKTDAGAIQNNLVTNPLLIIENEIRYLNILDSSSIFYDVSTKLDIILEKAYLRSTESDVWTESIEYRIYSDPCIGGYWMDNSAGVHMWKSYDYLTFVPDVSSQLVYAVDKFYKVPLLIMENYKFTDASSDVIHFPKKYFLDILDGKIAMDSSMLGSKGEVIDIENYINFNYDTSLNEQQIVYNVVYHSPRMSLAIYDPSAYYWNSMKNQEPSSKVIDNGVYQLDVHHTGPYTIEIYGWDSQNNLFNNNIKTPYSVWQKFPTILSYLDMSTNNFLTIQNVSTFITPDEASTLISQNLYPLFDRQIPLEGLSLEYDLQGIPYISVPSLSYFIDVPNTGDITRFYNLTEQCYNLDGSTLVINQNFEKFYNGDNVVLVQWDKHSLSFLQEVSALITTDPSSLGMFGEIFVTLNQIPPNFIGQEASTEVYILNDTERFCSNASNNIATKSMSLDISAYQFTAAEFLDGSDHQLVGVIIDDLSTGYRWGSSFRVIDVSAYRHTFQGNLPQFVIGNPRYTLSAKHAFSSFADFQIDISTASEVDNNFDLYMNDPHHTEYYLDNTFVFVNLLFDQDYAIAQWYDPSTDNLLTKPYYPFTQAISVDISTLVIFSSMYDPSDYMLEQRNIWTVRNTDDKRMIFKVYNKVVPFIFNKAGVFDVQLEAYDKYGNIKSQVWEGLLTVQ
jgi:hypothetical protein